MNLAERAAATNRTIAKFRGKPFDWKDKRTCLHLARAQLLAMGHKPPRIPDFRSPIGAKRALKAQGASNLVELLDGLLLPRIAPAEMIVGDLLVVPGDPETDDGAGFGSIAVHGGGKVFGWHGADMTAAQFYEWPLLAIDGAWRLG